MTVHTATLNIKLCINNVYNAYTIVERAGQLFGRHAARPRRGGAAETILKNINAAIILHALCIARVCIYVVLARGKSTEV